MPFDNTIGIDSYLFARPQRYCLVIQVYDILEQEGRISQHLKAGGSVSSEEGGKVGRYYAPGSIEQSRE